MILPRSGDSEGLNDEDPMGPPKIVVEVHCIHCGERYLSSEIKWDEASKMWVCPVEGCGGCGYLFDIYPAGVMEDDDDGDDDYDYDDSDE